MFALMALDLFKYLDVLTQIDFEQIQLLVKGIAVLLAIVALAAVTYVLRTTFDPLIRIVQWLFAYSSGAPPNAVTAGVAHGARVAVWSGFIGLVVWFLAH